MSDNQLSGSIPTSLSALTNLTSLYLYDNQLSGTLPASLSALINLKFLYLTNNQLSGTIPASLSVLTKLTGLDLSNNQLSGSIPAGLGSLTNLQFLLLNNNQLTGCFPASLSVFCGDVSNQRVINFTNNSGLPGGGDFAAFCTYGTNSGDGKASASAKIDGVVSLSASGGGTYQWIAPPGAQLSSPTTNPVVSATIISGGVQTFTVIIGNGSDCSQTLRLSIAEQPLPVRLIDFSVQAINNQSVHVTWTTATEQDNDYFLLKRSKDLIQYEPVARVKAKEGAAFQHYAYTDDNPYTGTSYYRLTQIDLSGKSTTFPIVSVILREGTYGVFPNPVSSDQSFRVGVDEPETAKVNVYSADGRAVPFRKVGVESGTVLLKAPSKLSQGIYILTVEERGQTRKHRLVVE